MREQERTVCCCVVVQSGVRLFSPFFSHFLTYRSVQPAASSLIDSLFWNFGITYVELRRNFWYEMADNLIRRSYVTLIKSIWRWFEFSSCADELRRFEFLFFLSIFDYICSVVRELWVYWALEVKILKLEITIFVWHE